MNPTIFLATLRQCVTTGQNLYFIGLVFFMYATMAYFLGDVGRAGGVIEIWKFLLVYMFGITVIGMKQRPQGALRDMHSETYWTAAFKPHDRADLERWAELFGARRDWMPVLDGLDAGRREFILRHSRSGEAYISWVDRPLRPVDPPKRVPGVLGGRRPRA